jgi:cytoplasmic iron level regulating protein YaaA (DUF328/UPF0246 family)
LARATELVEDARKLSPDDIERTMGVSANIAALNHQRFMDWQKPFTLKNAKQSLLAFKGDVYIGLDAQTLSPTQLDFAQQHLRILSGLYGLLRPLDLMQPYRLEMGLAFANSGGKNLYEFWGEAITGALDKALSKSDTRVLVNLASKEYFRSVQPKALDAEVITPVFKDLKGDRYKVISFFAKKARGQLARFIIDKELNEPEGIKKFKGDGYRYSKAESTAHEWVFTRDTPPSGE